MPKVDDAFYDRVDAHINLSNEQMSEEVGPGMVSASNMYTVARFNAWVSAIGWNSAEDMAAAKDDTVEYFVAEYRKMLRENLDDYISNFEDYMEKPSGQA